MSRDTSHIEGVGDHQSVKAQFLAQQIGNNRHRESRRFPGIRIKRGDSDMAGHYGACARCEGGAERGQLYLLEMMDIAREDGQVEMRIDDRVAVAGKMLGRGERAILFNAAHIRLDKRGDMARIFAERAHVNDRIIRVTVYIRDRRKNPVHPYGAGFGRCNAPDGIGVLGPAGCRDGHGMRKGGATFEAHGRAAFEIGCEEQWDARGFLE